jgi:hypothetical protein
MSLGRVRKRCFVQIRGYEPLGIADCHRRFIREMARFQKTWNVAAKVSPPRGSTDDAVAEWTVATLGPNWRTTTDFHYFRWDDFVAADAARSELIRFPRGAAALLEFILTGTAFKYFIVAWRYGLFFLVPVVFLAVIIGIAVSLSRFAAVHSGLPHSLLWAPALALGIIVALRLLFGRLLSLRYMLDDWTFARDLAHRGRRGLEQRLDHFARELVRLDRDSDADEIVVHGHSLGAALSVIIVDRALQLDPQLGRRGKPLYLVSAGSSLLKVALHPAAGWLREITRRAANAPALRWVEYQALADVINVYKVDPLVALHLPATGKPTVKIIRIRHMLEEATYKRLHLDFLRVHRQTVMGNERRYFYDYYMLCCGPLPVAEWVDQPDRSVAGFAGDGALLDDIAAPAAPATAVAGA